MSHGTAGWVALAAGVVAFDAHAALTHRETLSLAFARTLRHPRRRIIVLVGWSYLSGHLFGLLPKRVDVLRRLG